jgi:hypothetical protein
VISEYREGPERRPAPDRASRRRRHLLLAAAAAGVALLAAWSWQPSGPQTRADRVVEGSRVGEDVPVPGRDGTTVRIDAVSAVLWCDGPWWPHIGTLTSGPVTAIDVVITGVMEPGEAARLASDLRATNALGRPYAGDSACECQNLCEAEPRATADGYTVRVLLQTGETLDGVELVVGASLIRWDV